MRLKFASGKKSFEEAIKRVWRPHADEKVRPMYESVVAGIQNDAVVRASAGAGAIICDQGFFKSVAKNRVLLLPRI